jgi:hypothetical protein
MITLDFIAILGIGIVLESTALFLLVYGIHEVVLTDDKDFCVAMVACFIFLSFLSGIVFMGAYTEYQNAKPQNQVKILKQKISDAEKEYQKYLIDHPELKAKENYTK